MAGQIYFGFNTTQAKTLERLLGSDDAGLATLASGVAALQTAVTNLNAWATALATKLKPNVRCACNASLAQSAHNP